ncbi:hypothetical protein GJ744_006180 [Endocarpon pusillum]|uniref:Uncharacterized protein n=1 Tax=Endocarpon pusillum TaxID=364733 RepID=A0A8H7A7B4_9EURO|nr:hypothetical protein GJ744_006180 [Endocarpon pusillum]
MHLRQALPKRELRLVRKLVLRLVLKLLKSPTSSLSPPETTTQIVVKVTSISSALSRWGISLVLQAPTNIVPLQQTGESISHTYWSTNSIA